MATATTALPVHAPTGAPKPFLPTRTPASVPTASPVKPVALKNWTAEQARGILNITNEAQAGLYRDATFEHIRAALVSIFPNWATLTFKSSTTMPYALTSSRDSLGLTPKGTRTRRLL